MGLRRRTAAKTQNQTVKPYKMIKKFALGNPYRTNPPWIQNMTGFSAVMVVAGAQTFL
jgi:hypothetical protein